MEQVKQCLSNLNIKVYGWTDSMAVLGWLKGDPGKWKAFVANRVTKITSVVPPEYWHYVKSGENPADSASRGSNVTELIENNLWWQGPTWLATYQHRNQDIHYDTQEEVKRAKQVHIVLNQTDAASILQELISKHSSFSRLVRVLAWVQRFIKQVKQKRIGNQHFLTLQEIKQAKVTLIKHEQQREFISEISNLKQKIALSLKSKILTLNPYVDDDGLLRVGGRLSNSSMDADMMHPVILPSNSQLTNLIIEHVHKLTFHGGARVTSAAIRQKYWILSGNRVVKKHLRTCVKCRRHNLDKQNQIMGDLPASRCNASRPFYHTGVDFTGFVEVKTNKGRGVRSSKGYIAVFVCMATKAIHLELVSDLTSTAFLAALRRMAARRGTPRHVYSDNGTNFLGASRTLEREYINMQSIIDQEFHNTITEMELEWHFNAPSWPSAGGLWEAAVKSLKYHLKRVIGDQKLTFEEYTTLLAQLEAVLNSRPLCALTEDPEDIAFLTPSSFLSSGPNLTIIETERDGRTRWYLMQKIVDDIWKRWQSEYLNQLTARSKWKQAKENIKLDDVVVIHDVNLPAGKWALGRVIELHPGKDGYVRVVSLKTKNGVVKRPITKISILPVYEEEQANKNNKNRSETLPQIKQNRTVKVSSCSIISLALSLLFFMNLLTSAQCSFNFTKFQDDQSLYFDKISNVQVIRDEWKIVVYYCMDPYWQGTLSFSRYIKQLEATCVKIKDQVPCDAIQSQLRHGYSELEYYNNILLSQHSPTLHSRQRRGLIDGVGYVANTLFGVLDERFAEQYQRDIKLININQEHLAFLWKNQTSVIEAEHNLLQRTEDAMTKQQKMINQHFIRLERALNTLNMGVHNTSQINDFTLAALLASNMLRSLENIQGALVDTITDVYQGNINHHLLTPEQLRQELSRISSQLPKELSLPIENIQTDLRNLYHLLNVKARMVEDYLLFEIKLPLISRVTFELFKVIEIPTKLNNTSISTIPLSTYVAINIAKEAFLPMSSADVRSCLHQDQFLLCKLQKPIFHLKHDESLCERDQISKQCRTSTSPCKNKWVELNKLNHYFYYCCDKCQLRVICEDQMTAQQLTGAGIVTLGQSCIIKTDEFTVYAHNKENSLIKINPDIGVLDIHPINNIINVSIPSSIIIDEFTIDHKQELKDIDNRIQRLKEATVLTSDVSYHDVHHYTLIYLMLGVGGTVGAMLAWRRIRRNYSVTVPGAGPEAEAEAGVAYPLPALRRPLSVCDQCSESEPKYASVSASKQNKGTSPVPRKTVFSIDENYV